MGGLLVEFSVRAALIAAATAAVLCGVRVRSASGRHLAWSGVVAAMLLLPLFLVWGPKATLRVLPGTTVAAAEQWSSLPMLGRSEQAAPASYAPAPAGRPPIEAAPSTPCPNPAPYIAFAIYLCGAGFLLLRLALGTARARTLARRSHVEDGFLSNAACVAPVTVGWFRPAVILPAGWRSWPQAEWDAVLAHEKEHARRRDPLAQWLAALNRCVFWFHPLAWWLERRLAALAEEACDAAALARGHDPREYSAYLILQARAVEQAGARLNFSGAAIGGGSLGERIRRLLDGRPTPALTRKQAACGAVLCALAIAAFAACNLGRAQKPAAGQLSMNEMARRGAEKSMKSAAEEQALLDEARNMTPEQASAKVETLKANPRDDRLCYQLMRYYEFKSDLQGKDALILWYIEHQPGGKVYPWNINPSWDRAGYEQGRALWLAHVKKPGASADIYERAAAYLEGADKPLAEEVLLAGRKAYPDEKRWAGALGAHYAQVLLGSAEPRTEYNVFRSVSMKEAHSPYARKVRAKLAASDDARVLAQTAQWVMSWGGSAGGERLGFNPIELAELLVDRALTIEPDNGLAQQVKFRAGEWKRAIHVAALLKLPPEERARLSGADRMSLLLGEMRTAGWRSGDEASAKARELLDLAARDPKGPSYGDAIFEANITLGKAALRTGDKRTAVRYMLAAAETPGSETLRQGGYIDMNLQRALVDWGERDAVAQFLERMVPKAGRSQDFQDWAAQIRKGINPDLRPTKSGCGKQPC
jgi:hypothetical protein